LRSFNANGFYGFIYSCSYANAANYMKKYLVLIILVFVLFLTGCIQKESENQEKNKQESNQLEQVESDDDIKNWQSYEKEDKGVRLKYHKDWYYRRDSEAEKEWGYDLYVGFAASEEILENGRPYPIELLIVTEDKNIHDAEYTETVVSMNNKNYILTTNNKNEYGDILEKMIDFLEVVIN